MTQDPFKDGREEARRVGTDIGFDIGKVVHVPDDAGHRVVIETITDTGETASGQEAAIVVADTRGDISLPEEGDTVAVARFKDRRPIVLGFVYTAETNVPNYTVGDRRITNGDDTAEVLLSEDGTVYINGTSFGGHLTDFDNHKSNTDAHHPQIDVRDSGVSVVDGPSVLDFTGDLTVSNPSSGEVEVGVSVTHPSSTQAAVIQGGYNAIGGEASDGDESTGKRQQVTGVEHLTLGVNVVADGVRFYLARENTDVKFVNVEVVFDDGTTETYTPTFSWGSYVTQSHTRGEVSEYRFEVDNISGFEYWADIRECQPHEEVLPQHSHNI